MTKLKIEENEEEEKEYELHKKIEHELDVIDYIDNKLIPKFEIHQNSIL